VYFHRESFKTGQRYLKAHPVYTDASKSRASNDQWSIKMPVLCRNAGGLSKCQWLVEMPVAQSPLVQDGG
jgi:hypothetical protein